MLNRNDCPKLAIIVKQVNLILDNHCQLNKIPFLRNANINISHLNSRGLHLSKLGSQSLQKNLSSLQIIKDRHYTASLRVAKSVSNFQSLQNTIYNEQNVLLPNTSGFKLASLNVTSLVKHIDELRIPLANNMIDVLAINETRLDITVSDRE